MKRFDLAKKLAVDAGELIKEMQPDEIILKKEGTGNFETSADLASQNLILKGISKYFPDDRVIYEETDIHLNDPRNAESIWMIDPIEGTNNYSFRRNYSAVSIGYARDGEVILGVVYNPFTNELYEAEKGRGAFLNGNAIKVRGGVNSLSEAYLATVHSYSPELFKKSLEYALKITPVPWLSIPGCHALTVCETAAGKFDLFYHQIADPWDVAAAFLIAKEAGAVIKNKEGQDVDFLWQHFYALGEEKLVDEFLRVINK